MGIIKLKSTEEAQAVKVEEVKEKPIVEDGESEEQWDNPAVLREDKVRASESSRHYVMNDGTTKSVYYAEPVSYYDETDKEWKYIDNSLEEKDNGFESKSGKYKTRITKAHLGKGVEIANKDKLVSWEYLGKQLTKEARIESSEDTILKVKNSEDKGFKPKNSTVVYENIEKGTDLEYCLVGNNVKENIIVREKSTNYRYLFALKTEGLKLRLSEDNANLELYVDNKKEDGTVEEKVEFVIPSPYMYDAKGVASDDVYYELEPAEEGKYVFAVVANEEWINATERELPVTIDPQIVVNHENVITKRTYYRNVYNSSSSGSGSSYSAWQETSSPYIALSSSSHIEYKTILTIRKSLINFMDGIVSNVKLYLEPYGQFAGQMYIDGRLSEYYYSSNGKWAIDITSKFMSAISDFTVYFEPCGYTSMNFYYTEKPPIVEIEYLTNENVRPTKKSFTLAGMAQAQVNLATGDMIASFGDTNFDSAIGDLQISHIYKKSSNDYLLGDNFRLNTHETFVKNYDSQIDATYVYTDSNGDKHGFNDYYYYIDKNGKKIYIDNGYKSSIAVEADGTLRYNGNIVQVEYKSASGLKALTRLEGLKHVAYFDQRSDELKQVEEKVRSYKKALDEFVFVRRSDGWIEWQLKYNLDNIESFEGFCSLNEDSSITLLARSDANYYGQLVEYRNNNSTAADIEEVKREINVYENKASKYLEQIKEYYKVYYAALDEQRKLKQQLPINFLTDGKIFKGYNEDGQLVSIYDMHDNYVVIEYEKYGIEYSVGQRIARIYDNHNKVVNFAYTPDNKLSCITDTKGRKTSYEYSDSKLTAIQYDTGEKLLLKYSYGNITSVVEEKKKLWTSVSYESHRPKNINSYILKDVTAEACVENANELGTISFVFMQNSDLKMDFAEIIVDKTRERYYFDDTSNLKEYRLEKDGVLVKAEQYEYVSYWNGSVKQDNPRSVITKANKGTLIDATLDSYTFVDGDTETTILDQFNNPTLKTTSAILVSKWMDSNNVEQTNYQTTQVEYVYDDNQKLVEEVTTVVYTNLEKPFVSHKKYNYNAYGEVIRTESFVQGEEYITGKTIEETVYDDKGNVIKSFTYNSLDTSSKFYKETEYDENGKVSAQIDETGENKTKYSYIDGTRVVREEQLPNGSKFAYGHDYDDSVTAISQSTEDGEENSTQKVYENGVLAEVHSGNNKIKYSFDYSNGFNKRKESICFNDVSDYINKEYNVVYNDDCTRENDEIKITNAKQEIITIRADKRGNVQSKLFSNGMSLRYTYGDFDKLSSIVETAPNSTIRSFGYVYDDLDNIVDYTETEGSIIKQKETFTYDNFGCVSTLTQNTGMSYSYEYKDTATRELKSILVSGIKIELQSDGLGRYKGKEFFVDDVKIAEESMVYRKVGDHATSMPVSMYWGSVKNGNCVLNEHLKYTYDKMGNITRICENGDIIAQYEYDKLNRLVREDNKLFGKTWLYSYDNNGNILVKKETAFTVKPNVDEKEFTISSYAYVGDQLRAYNDDIFIYDVIGNPTTYRGKTAVWERGRTLTAYDEHNFTYDAQGRRLTKDSIEFAYDSNGRVVKQSNGLEFFYDNTGIAGVKYDNKSYIYRKNAQGDVVALLDTTGKVVVKYTYDAWGNHAVEVIDTMCATIAELNPFRYRSYYYDTETGFYFLKTRYYDPEIGRFITIDGIEYLDPDTINGVNLYAYCGNNPISYYDPSGHNPLLIGLLIFTGVMTLLGAAYGGVSAGMAGGSVGDVFAGIGKGALNGLILGGGISLAVGGFAIGGNTILGSIMANYGLSISANMLEVAITQGKKSYHDGDGFWAGANDINNAMFANAGDILIGKPTIMSIPFYGTRITSKMPTIFQVLVNYDIDNIFGSIAFMASAKATLLKAGFSFGKVASYTLTAIQFWMLFASIIAEPNFENSRWILY